MGTQFKIPAFCILWGGFHRVLGWACLSTHNALGTVWFANGVVLMDLGTAPWIYRLWRYPEKLLCVQRSVWLTVQLPLEARAQSAQLHISTLLSFCFGSVYCFHVIFFFFAHTIFARPSQELMAGRKMKKLCMNLEALKIPTKDSSLDQCWYSSSDSDFQIPWIEGHTHVEDYFLIWCQITVFYWIINSFKLDCLLASLVYTSTPAQCSVTPVCCCLFAVTFSSM